MGQHEMSYRGFQGIILPSNISHKSSTNDKYRLLEETRFSMMRRDTNHFSHASETLTLRMMPKSVIESQMLSKVSIVFAFSPMDV